MGPLFLRHSQLRARRHFTSCGRLVPFSGGSWPISIFPAYSSLRLSDLGRLHLGKLKDNPITYKPFKTFRKTDQSHALPLTNKALKYCNEAREKDCFEGFFRYTEQYGNRVLKK